MQNVYRTKKEDFSANQIQWVNEDYNSFKQAWAEAGIDVIGELGAAFARVRALYSASSAVETVVEALDLDFNAGMAFMQELNRQLSETLRREEALFHEQLRARWLELGMPDPDAEPPAG